ncbi:neuropeptide B [Kryptolebias marmoratus]|uniref:Neuropeptide B-like n=1 Tax=Kryptolebias marmoratus TaxID=37003 RepID=A0A3Q3AB61_KRYMA|nr:neuropeptide B [Kryptolebias marmoratus]
MEVPSKLLIPAAVLLALLALGPTEAWYKQAAGPSYYSVGRASGLLSGIRRSPHVRRGEPPSDSGEAEPAGGLSELISHNSVLKRLPLCIKDITPILQSCELFQDIKGSLKCKADILLSLDSSDCEAD